MEASNVGDKSIGAILNSVRRLIRSYRLFSREVEREYGITGAQLFVLQVLDQGAPGQVLTVNELAERSFTHQSTVSEVVKRLKTKKFVVQRKSEEDLRKNFLSLSSTGKSLLKRAPRSPGAKLVEGLLDLSPKERVQLAGLLNRVLHTGGLDQESAELFFQEK